MISHPLNSNPFPGSFLNYKARMRLVPVTMQAACVLDYEGEFDTEHSVRTPTPAYQFQPSMLTTPFWQFIHLHVAPASPGAAELSTVMRPEAAAPVSAGMRHALVTRLQQSAWRCGS